MSDKTWAGGIYYCFLFLVAGMCDVWLIELVIRLIEVLWQLIQDKIAAGQSRRITFTKTEWQCLADEICKHDLAPTSEDKKITGAKVAEKVTRMKSHCKYIVS